MKTPKFGTPGTIENLPPRHAPYWNILEFCRHIGVEKRHGQPVWWLARVRTKEGGYHQKRLAPVQADGFGGVAYEEALVLAKEWFASPDIGQGAATPYPVGVCQSLKYEKKVSGFTIGDALRDYVEWKRVAAARSHFETSLSLINYHIVPRIGDIRLDDFTARCFTEFCRDILESAPKRGNQKAKPRRKLDEIDSEALRKRKKTLNALIGILRLATRMAWENGATDSERAWRCLRRVPNIDAPRHHFLTRDQCRRLLQSCRQDLGNLVRGALYSGCRVSELADLRAKDVGTDIFGLYIAPSKNGRARFVFLPEEGMAFFFDCCDGKAADAHVFTMASGRRWSGGHKHLFKTAVRDAGLPEDFVFHGLRHTYASQLVQSGTPLAVVARQLGHANTDTVSRTYGHLSCDGIEAELSRHFAPIEQQTTKHNSRISTLRHSLRDKRSAHIVHRSWPVSNFGLATGEFVESLKGR